MTLVTVMLIGLVGAELGPKIRTSSGEIEIDAESVKICYASGADCQPVATAVGVETAVQSAQAESAATIAELSAQLSAARSMLSSQSAAINDTMQSIAVSLGRFDRVTDDHVLTLLCPGARYIAANGECLSCAGEGPNDGYFHNVAAGLCEVCSQVRNHFVNASGHCVNRRVCTDAEYQTRAFDQANGLNRICAVLAVCVDGQYASITPTATRNRVCSGLRTCSTSQFVQANHTATSNRVCAEQAPACEDSEVEAIPAGPYQRRVCSAVYRSCSDIWEKNRSARSVDGYYAVTNYETSNLQVARWTSENCGDSGRIHQIGNYIHTSFSARVLLEKVRFYSVFPGGARGCRWQVSGGNHGSWSGIGYMQFQTSPERFDSNGKWVGGAKVNSFYTGAPGNSACGGHSGWYEFEFAPGSQPTAYSRYRLFQIPGGGPHHCPRISSIHLTGRDPGLAPQSVNQVYCDMRRGGWQLIYNRMNLFFTPDHMRQVCPRQGTVARLDEDSTSWCIPNTARRWRWDIAKEGTDFPQPANFKSVITNIPRNARAVGAPLSRYVNNRVKWYRNDFYPGSSDTSDNVFSERAVAYYQRAFHNRASAPYGCSVGETTLFGLTSASQGWPASPVGVDGTANWPSPATTPWGIGGGCDVACNMGGRNYTHPDGNIRYLLGNWTNLQGVSAGVGSACVPNDAVRYNFSYRFWAIE